VDYAVDPTTADHENKVAGEARRRDRRDRRNIGPSQVRPQRAKSGHIPVLSPVASELLWGQNHQQMVRFVNKTHTKISTVVRLRTAVVEYYGWQGITGAEYYELPPAYRSGLRAVSSVDLRTVTVCKCPQACMYAHVCMYGCTTSAACMDASMRHRTD